LKYKGDDNWEFVPSVRKEILFRLLNLMNPFPFRKQFHVIFCRNVMIYFDNPTRIQLVNKLYQFTAPGGYLLIGHSESIRSNDCPYEYVQPAIFRKGGG
jgi:chemotaxis protein methyltransferase CheR